MIEAVKAGADVYVPEADQRRRRRRAGDARGGAQVQARRAGRHAAAQHAAPDRRARSRSSAKASSATSGWSRSTATTTCGATESARLGAAPDLDYEMWTGPAPMRPYNSLVHPRSWRAFMEYGNGIVGDMCIHMLDMVRWMLDLGMAARDQFDRRHPGRQEQQGEHHRHADGHVRLRRPAGGLDASHLRRSARSEVSVGRDVLRRQGHAQGERDELRLHAVRQQDGAPIHEDVTYELDQFPKTGPRRIWSSTSRRPSAVT